MSKKILYVNDFLIGGGAEKVCEDSLNLMKNEYIVDIFYGTKKYSTSKNISEYIYSNEYFKKFLEKLNEFNPDIIHLHNFYHILSPSILNAIKQFKLKKDVKIIFTAHDFHLLSPNSGYTYFNWFNNELNKIDKNISFLDLILKKWDYRGGVYSISKQIQWVYNYKIKNLHEVIDVIITPSDFLSNLFKKNYKKVYTIRNPINFEIPNIDSMKHLDAIKQLVFIGRIEPEKGLYEFLYKYRNIFKENEFYFTIIGDGKDLQKIDGLIKKENLENKINLLGRKSHSETLQYLKNSHCLVVPSLWYENAPLSLVEGAVYKNKLLTMNYGGMKEIAEICGNYCFINENNEHNIIKFLKKDEFTDSYLMQIKNSFSKKMYKEQLIKIYEGII
jgi:glycosyltransferase involved in cell wall biosynthesis